MSWDIYHAPKALRKAAPSGSFAPLRLLPRSASDRLTVMNSPKPNDEGRLQSFVSNLMARPLFWVFFIALAGGWHVVRSVRTALPPAPPHLATIPEFVLTDQRGQSFGSADLLGKVWIANFIFTRCPTVCPALTERMWDIQHRTRNLSNTLHMVSFSVDPGYDTPEVLAEYAKEYRVGTGRWSFLTGEYDAVKQTVIDGLKVGMPDAPEADILEIFHGTHFVLVDADLQIRGYYASDDEDMEDRILRDAGLLIHRRDDP